ncbi:MAG: cohesin domain-containing protein, partial [Patescibacteria group bacterium]
MQTNICHRLTARTLILAVLLTLSGTVHAIGTESTITLRPHCLLGYEDDNTVLKDGGDPEQIRCPSFSVEDPQTLKTPDLQVGDILDLDIVVENPEKKDIARVRAWLAYDPNILQGDLIEIAEEYAVVTPGESDFDTTEGYAKIEASSEGSGADDLQIFIARVQFTVLKTTPGGTVVNFFDVQTGGHTSVVTGKDEEEEHLINHEPGALHVLFAEGDITTPLPPMESSSSVASTAPVSSSPAEISSASAASMSTELLTDGEACITNEQCRSSRCLSGICQGATPLAAGAACGSNEQCLSGSCVNNACVGGIPAVSSAASVASVASSQS